MPCARVSAMVATPPQMGIHRRPQIKRIRVEPRWLLVGFVLSRACSLLSYPKISVCLLVVAAFFCLVQLLLLLFRGNVWYISISFLWIMLMKDCSLLYLLLPYHKKKQYLSQTASLPRMCGKARGSLACSSLLAELVSLDF